MTAGFELRRCASPAALYAAAAEALGAAIAACLAARGACRLALAGGSTPRAVHAALLAGRGAELDWARVTITFGDERMVPPEDPASNYRMAHETLLGHLPVAPAEVLRIAGERAPEAAAEAYAAALGDAPLDVVMLGMGDDGHVASLFPGAPEAAPGARVIATTSPKPPHARVSLSYGALADAGVVIVVVAGAEKAPALAAVADELARGAPRLPAARVLAARRGPSLVLVDAAAAGRLGPTDVGEDVQ